MDSAVKVVVYIIVGATVIALFQSQYTAKTVEALTGGFANVLSAMRGGTTAQPQPAGPNG